MNYAIGLVAFSASVFRSRQIIAITFVCGLLVVRIGLKIRLLMILLLVGIRILGGIVGIERMRSYRIISWVYVGVDPIVGVRMRVIRRLLMGKRIGLRRKIRRMRRHHII